MKMMLRKIKSVASAHSFDVHVLLVLAGLKVVELAETAIINTKLCFLLPEHVAHITFIVVELGTRDRTAVGECLCYVTAAWRSWWRDSAEGCSVGLIGSVSMKAVCVGL
jgi:hypothetical protein